MTTNSTNRGGRKAGRPVGPYDVEHKVKTSFTIDRDLMAALLAMPNRSAFVNRAIREALRHEAHQADGRE